MIKTLEKLWKLLEKMIISRPEKCFQPARELVWEYGFHWCMSNTLLCRACLKHRLRDRSQGKPKHRLKPFFPFASCEKRGSGSSAEKCPSLPHSKEEPLERYAQQNPVGASWGKYERSIFIVYSSAHRAEAFFVQFWFLTTDVFHQLSPLTIIHADVKISFLETPARSTHLR